MKASELRKVALERQKELFEDNYNSLIQHLDEFIELKAKRGSTYIKLINDLANNFYFGGYVFSIDCDTYARMKQYYKELGFKIRWTLGDNIEISW